RFSYLCEQKLNDVSRNIQRLETTLSLLETKLQSIDGLSGSDFRWKFSCFFYLASPSCSTVADGSIVRRSGCVAEQGRWRRCRLRLPRYLRRQWPVGR